MMASSKTLKGEGRLFSMKKCWAALDQLIVLMMLLMSSLTMALLPGRRSCFSQYSELSRFLAWSRAASGSFSSSSSPGMRRLPFLGRSMLNAWRPPSLSLFGPPPSSSPSWSWTSTRAKPSSSSASFGSRCCSISRSKCLSSVFRLVSPLGRFVGSSANRSSSGQFSHASARFSISCHHSSSISFRFHWLTLKMWNPSRAITSIISFLSSGTSISLYHESVSDEASVSESEFCVVFDELSLSLSLSPVLLVAVALRSCCWAAFLGYSSSSALPAPALP
mmetsp:Transcript_16123/g.43995  ORF Transcript_16123/g.43995 Transcript_16123/m.43995 type:complete len:278 (+) Transcript_16123:1266-2099(+)